MDRSDQQCDIFAPPHRTTVPGHPATFKAMVHCSVTAGSP